MRKRVWLRWYETTASASAMSVKLKPLSETSDWLFHNDGTFRRADGKFFAVSGAEISAESSGREVARWDQPLLVEVGEGAVVLIKQRGRYLLQVKAEPGVSTPLLAPTIQASASNLAAAHGGKRPRFAELLDTHSVRWISVVQDPGRFHGKVNRYGLVDLPTSIKLELNNLERWFSVRELKQVVQLGKCNSHLAQALVVAWLG